MYITVSEGRFSHSGNVGTGQSRLVRISDIEGVTETREHWYGEAEPRHKCSNLFLASLRNEAGRRIYCGGEQYGSIAIRETVAEITALIQAAMPRHTSMHDHTVAARVNGTIGHVHEVAGAIEHVHVDRRAPANA